MRTQQRLGISNFVWLHILGITNRGPSFSIIGPFEVLGPAPVVLDREKRTDCGEDAQGVSRLPFHVGGYVGGAEANHQSKYRH
jgi:hypothetical protein